MPWKQKSILRCGAAAWVFLWMWTGSVPVAWAGGKMGAVLHRAARAGSDARALNSIPGVFYREGTPHVRLLMKLTETTSELRQAGVELGTRAGDIYTATAPVERLSEVAAMPEVVRMEAVQRGWPLLEVSVPDIHADEVWTNRRYGNQGEGVLVGIVDTGIFYEHKAFLDEQGNNRILYIKNITSGTECDPQSIQDKTCAETDEVGHGTAVMGILAGAGSDACTGRFDTCVGRGVAPRADMVVVKSENLFSDEVIEGVGYFFDKAEELGMPAVVNLSLGFFAGPRDGSSLLEQAISDEAGPGRIIVASAGNEALMRGHAQVSVSQGEDPLVIAYNDQAGGRLPEAEIQGWYDAQEGDPNDMQVKVWAFDQQLTGWVAFGAEETVQSSDGDVTLSHVWSTPKARGFVLSIENANTIQWWIQMRRTGQGEKQVDLWINPMTFPDPDGGLPKFRFTPAQASEWARTTVTPPCTADQVICVASYNTNCAVPDSCEGPGEGEQTISSFSSRGPRRDGRVGWPWIAAPGQAIHTASNGGASFYDYRWGTSMSSPHVAGTVALMFGASLDDAGSYSVADIKDFLRSSARDDDGDRDIWGWGKLDASGAVSQLFSTLPPPPPPTPHGLGEGDDICFIATAAFGDIDAPPVKLLREMRDRFLLTTSWGRSFVQFYYHYSPPVAVWLKGHPLCSRVVRLSLMPAVGWSEIACHGSPLEQRILLVLSLSVVGAACCLSVRRRTR